MKRAFTLVELLIVFAIIGIILAVVIPLFGRTPQMAQPAAPFGIETTSVKGAEAIDFQNGAGQCITVLEDIDNFGTWLASHRECEIICVAPLSTRYGDCNRTDALIIVYRRIARP
jgi:prepilin-type N-terminal cleavage/methylation domain-containing protein